MVKIFLKKGGKKMKGRIFHSIFFGAVILMFLSVNVSALEVNLWDIFPQYSQGENGVYCKAYDEVNNIFRFLDYIGPYKFGTPSQSWNIPYISRSYEPWIVTHPGGWEFGGGQEQTFLLLSFPQQIYIDRITGSINPWDGGYIQFQIIGSNFSGPSDNLYSQYVGGSQIDFNIGPFSKPYQFISFHVGPEGYSYYDTTFYKATIDYRPVPLPSTIFLFGSVFPFIPFVRKYFKETH
jgi:hypothetical protein